MSLTESSIGRNLKKTAGRAGLVLSVGLIGAGCTPLTETHTPTPVIRTAPTIEPTMQLVPTPMPENKEKIAVPTPESPKTQWDKLPALERLKRLRADNFNLEGLDTQKENIRAVVEFFCQNVRCNIPLEEIINNRIIYVDPTSISQKTKEKGFDLTDSQIEQQKNSMSFVVSQTPYETERFIFINPDAISKEANRAVKEQPNLARVPNFKTYLQQNVEFASLSYLNTPTDELLLNEPFHYGDYYIYKFIGFTLRLKDEKGDELNFSGVDIAITELLAQKISTKSGFVLLNPRYKDGVELLSQLVSSAGISDQEFIEYTDGRRSIPEFLGRIGNLKNNESYDSQAVGANAIIVVGFVTLGTKDKNAGKKYLESVLNLQPTYER